MAEADVKAATLLTTLIGLAEGRGEAVYSEDLMKHLMQKQASSPGEIEKKSSAFATAPVGASSQRAAIYAVAEVGKRYSHLRRSAERALRGISEISDDMRVDALYALAILNEAQNRI